MRGLVGLAAYCVTLLIVARATAPPKAAPQRPRRPDFSGGAAMTTDARVLNWQFVAPPGTGPLLVLPIDGEQVEGAVVPTRDPASLSEALAAGPFAGIVAGDLASWADVVGPGGTVELVSRLAGALASNGWMYVGFPNAWFPARPWRSGSATLPQITSALRAGGLSNVRPYFALPDQRCPAYLLAADRSAELDHFLRHLFFPYVKPGSSRAPRTRQRALDGARSVALRVPHSMRVRFCPALAVVARSAA